MRFTNIVATLAVAASVSAWKIPQNTQDGVYTVETLEDGTEVHTKIADAADIDRSIPEELLDISPVPKSELETRADGRIWCGCGFDMNRGDCDAAVADLKRQSDGSVIRPNESRYSIRGKVVAFACNRGSSNWGLLPYAVTEALSAVTGSCGLYIAGAQQNGDDDKAFLIGYQRWGGNDDFCGSARSSPKNHC